MIIATANLSSAALDVACESLAAFRNASRWHANGIDGGTSARARDKPAYGSVSVLKGGRGRPPSPIRRQSPAELRCLLLWDYRYQVDLDEILPG
jgi:hypothetical protein